MSFKDHFSGHAASYAAYRPQYPDRLFAELAACCAQRRRVWDCATGNGQAARRLARYFEQVVATDASEQQVAAAEPASGVEFRVAPAEESGLADHSVDLITVAQALHWFDIDAFFAEAQRVLAAGGVLAVWSYERCTVNPEIDRIVDAVFDAVEQFWPPERDIVESGYAGIELPFDPLALPAICMEMRWTADEALGYFRTWSASRRYLSAQGSDPFVALEPGLRAAWGSGRRCMRWPLNLLAGRA
ncbi:MAG: class I SAM-dependent methyltransferase [Gammaproteobacteria bacterium]|nr:class I SAM-dependent methyltransferase [Gammaproteobacteria bacterium]